MDKRKLASIPRETVTKEMMDIATINVNTHSVISRFATVKLLKDDNILLINFFKLKNIINGNYEAEFRTFFTKEDYISQNFEGEKPKWITSSLANMMRFDLTHDHYNQEFRIWVREKTIEILPEDGTKLVEDFFAEYQDGKEWYPEPWRKVVKFQESVMSKRLAAKHKAETDIIDATMDPIKEAPQEFYSWVYDQGLSFSRYLVYQYTDKDKIDCYCTHCKNKGIVTATDTKYRNNEKGTCPFCGSTVMIKATGRMPHLILDERNFVYVDPIKDGFIYRYFRASRSIRSDSVTKMCLHPSVQDECFEICREFITFTQDKQPKVKGYEWIPYKQRGPERWCYSEGKIDCAQSILYPGNLPGAWEHTPMKYSGLEYLSRKNPTVAAYYQRAISVYLDFDKLEWICKMGLTRLAMQIILSGTSNDTSLYGNKTPLLNFTEDTIYKILGLNKLNVKMLQEIDGSVEHIKVLHAVNELGVKITSDQLKDYVRIFGDDTKLLTNLKGKATIHKLIKYVTKESLRYPVGDCSVAARYHMNRYTERDLVTERQHNMAADWTEYLGWCKELKYDTDNLFIYMPHNFKAVHNRTSADYIAHKDRIKAKKKKRMEDQVRRENLRIKKEMQEILEANVGKNAFMIRGKGLVLVVPKDAADLKKEGEELHHCVGTYVERVAKGLTNIFFIRRSDEPDKPYYTMEWSNNKVVQCRGKHNKEAPPEVKAFCEAFKNKMIAYENSRKGEAG
jgi:hypothetical protein